MGSRLFTVLLVMVIYFCIFSQVTHLLLDERCISANSPLKMLVSLCVSARSRDRSSLKTFAQFAAPDAHLALA